MWVHVVREQDFLARSTTRWPGTSPSTRSPTPCVRQSGDHGVEEVRSDPEAAVAQGPGPSRGGPPPSARRSCAPWLPRRAPAVSAVTIRPPVCVDRRRRPASRVRCGHRSAGADRSLLPGAGLCLLHVPSGCPHLRVVGHGSAPSGRSCVVAPVSPVHLELGPSLAGASLRGRPRPSHGSRSRAGARYYHRTLRLPPGS